MNKLGFGFLRLPRLEENDPASLDFSVINPMIDRFLAAGRAYFDTAYTCLGGASETALRETLVKRHPRSSSAPDWNTSTDTCSTGSMQPTTPSPSSTMSSASCSS